MNFLEDPSGLLFEGTHIRLNRNSGPVPAIPLYTSGTVLAAAPSPTDFGLVTDSA